MLILSFSVLSLAAILSAALVMAVGCCLLLQVFCFSCREFASLEIKEFCEMC